MSVIGKLNLLSREVGLHAPRLPFGQLAYRVGAQTYALFKGGPSGRIREQINVLNALPQVWDGLQRYTQVYPTSAAPFHTVDMYALVRHYDYFFIDIFGTYKDENKLWPEAVAVLKEINRRGKFFMLVSNTTDFLPQHTLNQLRGAGVKMRLEQVVAAGQTLGRVFRKLGLIGKTVLNIGNKDSAEYIRQGGARPVPPAAVDNGYEAIVIARLEGALSAEAEEILVGKVASGMPIILANADKFLPFDMGLRETRSFRLARRLREVSGGKEILVGKPEPLIYEEALERLYTGMERPLKILCIGDTLWTDIKGANVFRTAHPELQIDSLLVLSGTERRANNVREQLAAFMKSKSGDFFPTYILPRMAFPV